VVGAEGEERTVHEKLLCDNSAFFASAMKKEWKEGQERRVPLPDDVTSIVDLYIQWLYVGRIFSRQPTEGEPGNEKEFDLLINGFVFGEKVQDGDFKDAVVDALMSCVSVASENGTRWYPIDPWVDRAYGGTPEGSPLRKLLVDMHVSHGSSKWLGGTKSVEFLTDLAGRLLDDRKASPHLNASEPGRSDCWYHHHGDDGPCYRSNLWGI
jgi:hypothetical protein